MEKGSVLFITAYFNLHTISSVRMTKLSRYFIENGWKVFVVRIKQENESEMDFSLIGEETKQIETFIVTPVLAWRVKKFLHAKKQLLHKGTLNNELQFNNNIKNEINNRLIQDKFKVMLRDLKELLFMRLQSLSGHNTIKRVLKNNKIDLIISSYDPHCALWLGMYAKRCSPNSCFIGDFRDPVVLTNSNCNSISLSLSRRLQKYYIDEADMVTMVSKDQKKYILDSCKASPKQFKKMEYKAHVITNGFDIKDLEIIKDLPTLDKPKGVLSLGYTGVLNVLHPELQNPSMLLECIRSLLDEGAIKQDEIRIHYAGPTYFVLQKYLQQYNLESIVENHGLISRTQSLLLQRSVDLLLVFSWNTEHEQGVLTGKLFEYMMMDNPLIAIISGDKQESELRNIIEECNLGIACEYSVGNSDKSLLREYIYNSIQEIRSKGCVTHNPDLNKLGAFNYNNLVYEFINIHDQWKNKQGQKLL